MNAMSEENKNSLTPEEEQQNSKPFSVNIADEDFAADDIPAPESDVPSDGKAHKVVRYVDNAPKEKEQKAEKKKGGFFGEFLAGAAAGAKTVGEGISAGIKTVSEKKPAEVKEKAEKEEKVDETQFPKDEKKSSGSFMSKLNSLPIGAVIGGAAVLLVILVAIILICATSCAPSSNTPSDNSSSGNEITINPDGDNSTADSEPEGETVLEVPTRKEQFVEAFNANNDVMGWLYIPGLTDVDAGVCFSYDKTYPYDKRDITGKKVSNTYWIDGAYYTHFRNICGETSDELSKNTVIFGHSDLGLTNLSYTNDDPTGPLFSQLFSFKDPSFAEQTPYIYLTLPGEDTVWEIFAVFYNDANAISKTFSAYYSKNGGSLWYIEPSPVTAEYQLMLDTARARSLYDYDVEVTTNDRILTLSTCTVGYGLQARSNYRFVIVAKLVEDPETNHIDKNASFTINADAPIPSTYKEEFEDYVANWKPSEK